MKLSRRIGWMGATAVLALVGGVSWLVWNPWGLQGRTVRAQGQPSDRQFLFYSEETGTVEAVLVQVGQRIEQGTELIQLNQDAEVQALERARRELQVAAMYAADADVAVAMPPEMGVGGVIVPMGPLTIRIPTLPRSSGTSVAAPRGPIEELPAVNESGATEIESSEATARDPVDPARRQAAQASVAELESQVAELNRQREDALTEAQEAQRNLAVLRSLADSAQREADKARMLLTQGAIAANESNRAESQALVAKNNVALTETKLQDAEGRASSLEAQAKDKQRQLASAQESLAQLPASVAKSTTRRVVRRSEPQTREVIRLNPPARVISRRAEAKPIPTEVAIDGSKKRALDEKLERERTRVDEAEAALLRRRLVAHRGMEITEILVKPGSTIGSETVILRFRPVPELDAKPFVPWDRALMDFILSPIESASNPGVAPNIFDINRSGGR